MQLAAALGSVGGACHSRAGGSVKGWGDLMTKKMTKMVRNNAGLAATAATPAWADPIRFDYGGGGCSAVSAREPAFDDSLDWQRGNLIVLEDLGTGNSVLRPTWAPREGWCGHPERAGGVFFTATADLRHPHGQSDYVTEAFASTPTLRRDDLLASALRNTLLLGPSTRREQIPATSRLHTVPFDPLDTWRNQQLRGDLRTR